MHAIFAVHVVDAAYFVHIVFIMDVVDAVDATNVADLHVAAAILLQQFMQHIKWIQHV